MGRGCLNACREAHVIEFKAIYLQTDQGSKVHGINNSRCNALRHRLPDLAPGLATCGALTVPVTGVTITARFAAGDNTPVRCPPKSMRCQAAAGAVRNGLVVQSIGILTPFGELPRLWDCANLPPRLQQMTLFFLG